MAQLLYTYQYDRSYLPSFPVIEVQVSRFGSRKGGGLVSALVDSGSDGTMIPMSVLKQLQARKIGRTYMVAINGVRQLVDVFELTLQLVGQQMGRVEVLGDKHNNQMILGREVLNHLVTILNGPANMVEIAQ